MLYFNLLSVTGIILISIIFPFSHLKMFKSKVYLLFSLIVVIWFIYFFKKEDIQEQALMHNKMWENAKSYCHLPLDSLFFLGMPHSNWRLMWKQILYNFLKIIFFFFFFFLYFMVMLFLIFSWEGTIIKFIRPQWPVCMVYIFE